LTGSATTKSTLDVAKDGTVSFRIDLDRCGIVDGQSVAQLFDGAWFRLTVGGQTYSVRAWRRRTSSVAPSPSASA
jgi:hypothetical protein